MAIDPNSPEFFEDFDPFEFDGKKDYVDGKSDAHVNRANACRLKALDPEWQETTKQMLQNRANDPEWQEKNRIANQKKPDDPQWREKQKAGSQKRSYNEEWRENVKVAIRKANNKKISCDGIIYESGKAAALALAPATRLTNGSKISWFEAQMKKYPDRYFYIVNEAK